MVALKTKKATKELLEAHYKDLIEKPFFPKLRDYMLSGPVSLQKDYDVYKSGLIPLLF